MKAKNPTPSLPFVLALALVFLGGLLASNGASSEESEAPFPKAQPESTGLSTEALEKLATIVDGYLEQEQIVGAELHVIKNRQTVLHRTFGWRDREAEIPMEPNTIFNIRSMTKPVTGAAAQMLIDDGKLSLDDPASRYIPGFDNEKSREITVRQLLTHRGGLPVTILTALDQFDSLQSMADAIGKRGPQFKPDSKFWYSDPGTDVVGAIVERVSGRPLEVFWQERLFDPLGMKDAFVPSKRKDPRWDRLASSYIGRNGEWTLFWDRSRDPLYPYTWGSQTIYCTTTDYAHFLALWMDGGVAGDSRLLSSAAISRSLTPVSEMTGMGTNSRAPTGFSNLSTHYGQMSVLYMNKDLPADSKPEVIGHSGSDGTFAWAWPGRDLMVLYFTQSRGGITGLSLERWIDELLLHPEKHPTTKAEDPSKLYEGIEGEYRADFGSIRATTLKVSLRNERPTLDLGLGRIIELRDPDAEGRWFFSFSNSTSVSFPRNRNGIVEALRMHEGGWDFEAPRLGLEIVPEIEAAELQKYLGSYEVSEGKGTITVKINNHRLTLDKSALPGRRPTELFELHLPDESGSWNYRINKKLKATFDEEKDGTISGLKIHNDGKIIATASRSKESSEPLPTVEEIMALRKTSENEAIIAKLGGVRMTGTTKLVQSGMTGETEICFVGTNRYRSEIKLPQGSIIELLHPDGASAKYFTQEFVHEGKYLKQARKAQPLVSFLDWRENNESVEVIARKSDGDREIYVLRTRDGETSPIEYYLDAATGDVLRTEMLQLSTMGDTFLRTKYEDYRDIGGLRFPHRFIVTTQLGGDVIQEFQQVEIEQDLDDELFRPQAAR